MFFKFFGTISTMAYFQCAFTSSSYGSSSGQDNNPLGSITYTSVSFSNDTKTISGPNPDSSFSGSSSETFYGSTNGTSNGTTNGTSRH